MIKTVNLSRTFRGPEGEEVLAVRGIDFSVTPGETVAVLGPNGAGKSTLMRMLSTLLPPTGGTAQVAGFDITTQSALVRERIGYVGQGNGAGHTQRAMDEVVTQGRIYGLDRAAARARAADLLSILGLEQLAKRKTQAMSGGQRRRLDLAIGLVNLPSLLFLDEPSTGLDPQNRANLWDHIIATRQSTGMTVVFTTHYLEEADQAADRIVVVDHGRIIAEGTPEQLKQSHVGDRLTFDTTDSATSDQLAALLAQLDGVRTTATQGATVTARASNGRAILPAAIVAAHRHGITVTAADTKLPTLDDVFLELTGRSLRDAGEITPRRKPGQRTAGGPAMTTLTTTATTTPRPRNTFNDILIVMGRELRPVTSDPFSLVVGLIQPLFFLLLFGPLVAATAAPNQESPWAWFVPGILVMTSLFGTASTGSNLQYDLQGGSHERLLVTPLTRSSLFIGRSLKEFVPLIVQAIVVIVVMVPFGFRPDIVGGILGLLLLGILGVGIGSLSYALAIAVREQDWMFWTVHQTLLFPLMILSGMLLPLDDGPGWMRVLAQFNPLTHVVEAERNLFAGQLATPSVAFGFLAAIATAVLGFVLGLRALRASTN